MRGRGGVGGVTEASSANLTSVTDGGEQTDPPVRRHELESSAVVPGDSALSGALIDSIRPGMLGQLGEDWEQN